MTINANRYGASPLALAGVGLVCALGAGLPGLLAAYLLAKQPVAPAATQPAPVHTTVEKRAGFILELVPDRNGKKP